LSKRETGRTVYILDEPDDRLHFADIERLLHVLNQLADRGNTVIVIEHNPEVIKSADYVIDLGPEGGEGGGKCGCIWNPGSAGSKCVILHRAIFKKKAPDEPA